MARMPSRYQKPSFYCFSPPVMLATFVIEIALACYVLWRHRHHAVAQIIVGLLACLAIFQLAEFMVCEGTWLMDSLAWAKCGYVAITLLLPLGIHLIANISRDRRRWPYLSAYALAALFSSYFLLIPSVSYGQCLGNYVIFEHASDTVMWYALYYYGLLCAGVAYALLRARTAEQPVCQSLRWLAVGYASFIIPTTIANIIDPETIRGIPSIMCGFAVLLAVVLVVKVLPLYQQSKKLALSTQKVHNKK